VLDGLAAVLFLTEGKWQHIGSIFRAHWTFFPNFKQVLRKRRAMQKLVKKNSIGKENTAGRFGGSIVWQYYAMGRKRFSELR
jgi:hypothetical protein